MTFLNPTYLWALFALAIPLAIHLWSKKEGRTIKIGSIKLLDESDSKKSSSIQLNELLLLLLRLFLITILILIIAEPQLEKKVTTTPLTYIVEPALLDDRRIASMIDTLDTSNIKFLQKGFPEFSDDTSVLIHNTPNYWYLAKEMQDLRTDSIVVFTNAFSKGLKGIRPILNNKIHWILLNPERSIKEKLIAERKGDSIKLVSVLSNSDKQYFTKKKFGINDGPFQLNDNRDSVFFNENSGVKSLKINKAKSYNTLIYYDDQFREEKIYIEASLKAIAKYSDYSITVNGTKDSTAVEPSKNDLLVWLSADEAPKNKSKMLFYEPDDLASSLIEKGKRMNTFYLTSELNADIVVEQHFAEQLLKVLGFKSDLKNEIEQYDKTTVALNEISSLGQQQLKSTKKTVNVAMTKWLWLLLVLSLIAERVVSKIRKQ